MENLSVRFSSAQKQTNMSHSMARGLCYLHCGSGPGWDNGVPVENGNHAEKSEDHCFIGITFLKLLILPCCMLQKTSYWKRRFAAIAYVWWLFCIGQMKLLPAIRGSYRLPFNPPFTGGGGEKLPRYKILNKSTRRRLAPLPFLASIWQLLLKLNGGRKIGELNIDFYGVTFGRKI